MWDAEDAWCRGDVVYRHRARDQVDQEQSGYKMEPSHRHESEVLLSAGPSRPRAEQTRRSKVTDQMMDAMGICRGGGRNAEYKIVIKGVDERRMLAEGIVVDSISSRVRTKNYSQVEVLSGKMCMHAMFLEKDTRELSSEQKNTGSGTQRLPAMIARKIRRGIGVDQVWIPENYRHQDTGGIGDVDRSRFNDVIQKTNAPKKKKTQREGA
ncbi:hypothetical protein DFH06DRAFT_1126708 [Mycena polygramma]|nr:hypothetical protein DFH06DRAFT_1126708 [Mycena polygramma]